MDNILSSTYSDGSRVNGVLSPYDGLRSASSRRSRARATAPTPEMPVITGQDAEVESVKSIIAGEQYSTIFKDTRELATVRRGHGPRSSTARSPR